MDTVNQVKEALSARSQTATLEELARQGRRQVRLIKAEHVAAMISSAVHTAIEESGFIPKDEADSLVERSREEFRVLLQQRQQEVHRLTELEELLRVRDAENADMRAELDDARAEQAGHSTGVAGAERAGSPAPATAASADVKAVSQPDDDARRERAATTR